MGVQTSVRDSWMCGARRGESGFSMVQMVITMFVVIVVATFAFMRVAVARDNMRLTAAARELAAYIEKARLDSIRRHVAAGQEATVTFPNANSYTVTMDHNYTGATSTRTFTLPEGVTLSIADANTLNNVALPASFAYDWRGRTTTEVRITLANTRAHTSVVGITRSGEVSLDRERISLTPGAITTVAANSGVISAGGTTTTGSTTGVTGVTGLTTGVTTVSTTGGSTTGGSTTGGSTTTGTTTGTTGDTPTTATTTGGTTVTDSTTGSTTGSTTTGSTTGSTTTGTTTGSTSSTTGSTTGNTTNVTTTPVCSLTVSSQSVSIRRQRSTNVTVTLTLDTTITARSDNGSVKVSFVSKSGLNHVYKIESINSNHTYTANVSFEPACDTSKTKTVKVTVTKD